MSQRLFCLCALLLSIRHVTDAASLPMGSGMQSGYRYSQRIPGWVSTWSNNSYGLTNCPPGSNFVCVAGIDLHLLALRSDGSLASWGDNTYGKTNCPPGNNYVAIAGGCTHSLALRSDGSLVCWGGTSYGQTNCPPGKDYVAIAAGYAHCVALRNDGSLVSWGYDNGSGATNYPSGNDFVAIAAGSAQSFALRSDGSLIGWGASGYGQLNYPAGSNYVAIAANIFHSLALRNDGTVVGWGLNSNGQTDCPTDNNCVAISAGTHASYALRNDGTVAYWGTGSGDPYGNDCVAIACGGGHVTVIKATPFLQVTNSPMTVGCEVATCHIAGSNSPLQNPVVRVVGTMFWTNELNGAKGAIAASDDWTIDDIPLEIGGNRITVYGSNSVGAIGSSSVTVTRGTSTDIWLVSPPDRHLTNECSMDCDVYFGSSFPYRYLLTNAVPDFDPFAAFLYTNAISFPATGTYYWTALGYDSSSKEKWAAQTNRLTIAPTLSPAIRLIGPADGMVLTNTFAVDLDVDYGGAKSGHQLSIDSGVSWFNHDPDKPAIFEDVGTYRWTARANWWYAEETNTLTVTTNYTGSRAIFLLEPADKSVIYSLTTSFRVVTFGSPFTFLSISTNDAAFLVTDLPVTLALSTGVYTWTARGSTLPGPVYVYAPSTNTFSVVDPLPEGGLLCGIALAAALLAAKRRR